jgi:hypothetical protein
MQGEVARDARGIEEGRIVILQNLLCGKARPEIQ